MDKNTVSDDLWRKLVQQTLQNALFNGLNQESLMQSADALHIPQIIVQSRIHNVKIDIPRLWWEFLDTDIYTYAQNIATNSRIRDKITLLVKHRILTQMAPYKPVVRNIFTTFALPQNAGFATQHIWDTAHHMWMAIGDTTPISDHNYYTKRAILSGVLFTSISFWMQDDTNTNTDTYIDHRIDDALRLGKLKDPKNLAKFTEYMPFMNHPLKMRD